MAVKMMRTRSVVNALMLAAALLVLISPALAADTGEGSLLQSVTSGAVYVMSGGERHLVPDIATFTARRYRWEDVQIITDAELAGIPEGFAFLPEGALIRVAGDIDVWIIKYAGEKQFRRLILSPHVFDSYEHLRWEDIRDVPEAVVNAFTESTLVRADGDTRVYQLAGIGDTGWRYELDIVFIAESDEFDIEAIYTINATDRDAYVDGGDVP